MCIHSDFLNNVYKDYFNLSYSHIMFCFIYFYERNREREWEREYWNIFNTYLYEFLLLTLQDRRLSKCLGHWMLYKRRRNWRKFSESVFLLTLTTLLDLKAWQTTCMLSFLTWNRSQGSRWGASLIHLIFLSISHFHYHNFIKWL